MRVSASGVLGFAAALLGCSVPPEAAIDGPAPLTGRRSFVVTSTLKQDTADGGPAPIPLPTEHRFTMVLDWDRTWAIMGASGSGANGPNETSARFEVTGTGGTINQSLTIHLGTGSTIAYNNIEFAVTDAGLLTGAARGQAWVQPPNTDIVSSAGVLASTGASAVCQSLQWSTS